MDVNVEGEVGVDPEHPVKLPDGLEGILSRLFTDEWYLKFFYMSRIAYENNRFIAQTDALTGTLGETIKFNYNDQELVQVNYRAMYVRLFGGYFINTKYSSQFSAYVFYNCGGLTSVKLGWNHLNTDHTGTFLKEEYQIKASFSDPAAGVAFQY